jgi:hypothetical protein
MNYASFTATRDSLRDETRANLYALSDWSHATALPWFWSELGAIVGKKVRPLPPHDAIRKGLQTSYADRGKMPAKADFYIAQLTMLDVELRRYTWSVQSLCVHPHWFAQDAKVIYHHGAIDRFLSYAIVLLEQASGNLAGASRYGGGASQYEHAFHIFKGAEQVIYGRFSGMTHDDHAPFVGTAILRTALEIRLRRAFGLQGLVDQAGTNFRPIDLSKVFEAMRPHKANISFASDIDDVIKIYRWSNFYLHGGWRDYPWVAGFALNYVRPLLVGLPYVPGKGSSMKSGVQMPLETWHAIRAALDPAKVKRPPLWKELLDAVGNVLKQRSKQPTWHLDDYPAEHAECVFN